MSNETTIPEVIAGGLFGVGRARDYEKAILNESINYTVGRAAVARREKWSVGLAYTARILTVVACLGSWALVVVSIFTHGPVAALALVAIGATVTGIPLFAIASASLRARYKVPHVVADAHEK